MYFFIYLFFLPAFITLIEFLVFLVKGSKPMNGILGFALDVVQLIGFPYFYLKCFKDEFAEQTLFLEPYEHLGYLIIVAIVLGYFLVTYFKSILHKNHIIIILCLLGVGLFINLNMIYNQDEFLSIFNIPIILLFIMQIVSKSNQLINNQQ